MNLITSKILVLLTVIRTEGLISLVHLLDIHKAEAAITIHQEILATTEKAAVDMETVILVLGITVVEIPATETAGLVLDTTATMATATAILVHQVTTAIMATATASHQVQVTTATMAMATASHQVQVTTVTMVMATGILAQATTGTMVTATAMHHKIAHPQQVVSADNMAIVPQRILPTRDIQVVPYTAKIERLPGMGMNPLVEILLRRSAAKTDYSS